MLTLPQEVKNVILSFVALFSERVRDFAQILLLGAILALGKRTVSAALTDSHFQKKDGRPSRSTVLAPQVGLEPTTLRLTAACSAIELLRNSATKIISNPE